MPKHDLDAGCTETQMGQKLGRICFCTSDNCNSDLKTCLGTGKCVKSDEGPGHNDTKTTAKDQNSTEDGTLGTSKEDQNPTEVSAAATSEGNQQSTEDGNGATAEAEQESTGNPGATNGNQRVAESNQLVFVFWMLVILIIESL